jgi:hypothetical protein
VNGGVAPRAFTGVLEAESPVGRLRQFVKSGVALQTELAAFTANQQVLIGGAVRAMATGTTFDLGGWVLVDKRSFLFDVTAGTGFRRCLHETGRIEAAVRAVTVRTFHQAFRHAMVYGLRKLGAHRGVTGVAEFRLLVL